MTLLITSRERLYLQGEWVLEIEGLAYPEDGASAGDKLCHAMELFVESARRVHAGFALSENEVPWVGQICRLVEGMPLGIELAAAWVRALTCREIAHELQGSLDFLAGSMHDVPARHESLRAVLDHSWQLLDPPQWRSHSRAAC